MDKFGPYGHGAPQPGQEKHEPRRGSDLYIITKRLDIIESKLDEIIKKLYARR
jgi:hypothetical protein